MIESDVVNKLNQAVLDKYNRSDSGGWKEDNITEEILVIMKNNITEISATNKIEWNICKYSGDLEKIFGDIAFIIKIYFTQDKYVEGVYFIEAKRFYFDKKNYNSIAFQKLKKYVQYSQSHRTMLYNIDTSNSYNILTLPTQHLISLNEKSIRIERYSENFEFLLNDIFSGNNLDYREEQVNDVKGFKSNTLIKFKYIVNASISLKHDINMDLSKINDKFYKDISYLKKRQQKQNNKNAGPTMKM